MGYIDKDKQREFQRLWKARRRREAVEALGGRCAVEGCDVTDPAQLIFDHIDPFWKEHRPCDLWSMRSERREAELMKMQLLCVVHEKEKRSRNDDNRRGRERNEALRRAQAIREAYEPVPAWVTEPDLLLAEQDRQGE